MHKVVFLRHGQSVWNKDNLFTGWVDVGLSQKGKKEAKEAGVLIKKAGFKFDLAFCSVLKRAKQTLKIVLKELSQTNLPQEFAWQLNERHYGALQGRNKKETVKKFGEEQTQIWRRSFKTKPPQLKKTDKFYPGMTESQLPLSESLEDTFNRVIPYWQKWYA